MTTLTAVKGVHKFHALGTDGQPLCSHFTHTLPVQVPPVAFWNQLDAADQCASCWNRIAKAVTA